MEYSVRWRRDPHLPAFAGKSDWQIAHNVTNPANFAAGKRAVLRREKNDLLCSDF